MVSLSLVTMIWGSELGARYMATFKFDLPPLLEKIKPKKTTKIALLPTPTPTPTPVPKTIAPAVPGVRKPVISPEEEATKEATSAPKSHFPTPEPIQIATQRSGEIRFKVEWPRALRAFAKNPLLGTGYSSVTLATFLVDTPCSTISIRASTNACSLL